MELPKGFQGIGFCRRPEPESSLCLVFDHEHKTGGSGQPLVTFSSFFDLFHLLSQQICAFKTFFRTCNYFVHVLNHLLISHLRAIMVS